MNDKDIQGLDQVRQFLTGNEDVHFESTSLPETYQWVAGTLKRFKYFSLRKKEKSTVKAYMRKRTGYSRAQLTRLITHAYEAHDRWLRDSAGANWESTAEMPKVTMGQMLGNLVWPQRRPPASPQDKKPKK